MRLVKGGYRKALRSNRSAATSRIPVRKIILCILVARIGQPKSVPLSPQSSTPGHLFSRVPRPHGALAQRAARRWRSPASFVHSPPRVQRARARSCFR
jgi:hypothetical protein